MPSLLSFFFTFYILLFSSYFTVIHGVFSEESPTILARKVMEKITHLHFYFHDIVDGKKPSAINIIKPPSSSAGAFGVTLMADDPLPEGPEPNSKLVGKAQGIYALASQHGSALLMVMNFAFTEGTYNGSTLSMLGRNPIMDTVREMPFVGGNGIFRFARGYALAKTVLLFGKNNAVVEYNVSVSHF